MIEEVLYPIVCKINEYLSNYILVFLLIGVGLWYSIRTRFVQVRCFGEAMRKTFGGLSLKGGAQKSGMTSFQALATAIAAQVCFLSCALVAMTAPLLRNKRFCSFCLL